VDERIKSTVEKWIIKADNDLKTAEFGLSAPEPITDTICFHCQQAVEKYLKLFLVAKGKKPAQIHNISVLLQECIAIDESFSGLRGMEHLTDYSVTLRYPDDFYVPSVDEAEAAVKEAKTVRDFLTKKIF